MKTIKIKSSYLDYYYEIDIIKNKNNGPISTAFYFLDGQNAFKDKLSSYHKSLKAKKCLNKLKSSYIAIAIYSPNDERRYSMYSPISLEKHNIYNDLNFYKAFINDFNNLITVLEEKYKITKRYLITSSLACLTAFELAKYFDAIAFFSSAYFLGYDELEKYLNLTKKTYNFIAVGAKEFSDGIYNANDYVASSAWYYNKCKKNKAKAKLYVDPLGCHDEISWRNYLDLFIKKVKKDLNKAK